MLALTGVTGALGGLVADRLADLDPLLLVRDPARLAAVGRGDVPPERVRTCTYADGEACERALAGVTTLFMVSAAESPTRREEHRSVIAAAARAGVQHLVYTSFAGAAADATFTLGRDHHDAERALAESGLHTTLLRDNFYLDVLPEFADAEGVVRGPAGQGRVAAVARADVADVAAVVLRDPAAHAGATHELSGGEALTFAEVAERVTASTGRPTTFVDETVEEAYASRRAGWPDAAEFELDAWVSTYTAIADGSCARVTDDVRRLAGHAPRTLEDVLAGR